MSNGGQRSTNVAQTFRPEALRGTYSRAYPPPQKTVGGDSAKAEIPNYVNKIREIRNSRKFRKINEKTFSNR